MTDGAFTGGGVQPTQQLRPLGIGEILDAAIKLYGRNTAALWRIVAFVIIPVAIVQQAIIGSTLPAGAFVHDGTLYTFNGTLGTPAGAAIIDIVLSALAVLVVNGALALCLVDAYIGQPLNWRESLTAATGRLGSLILLSLMYGILVVIGLVLLIVPGVYLIVVWSVAIPALMFEHAGGFKALTRSFELVRGRWWATFAVMVVTIVALFIVLLVVGLVFNGVESALGVDSTGIWLGLNGIKTVVAALISYPFIGSVIAVLYIDLRVRKEGLDLELLAGALGRPSPSGVAAAANFAGSAPGPATQPTAQTATPFPPTQTAAPFPAQPAAPFPPTEPASPFPPEPPATPFPPADPAGGSDPTAIRPSPLANPGATVIRPLPGTEPAEAATPETPAEPPSADPPAPPSGATVIRPMPGAEPGAGPGADSGATVIRPVVRQDPEDPAPPDEPSWPTAG